MKCFNHSESDAIGLCKHCSKGICPACAIDTGDGLACEGKCAEQVRAVNRLIANNVKATKAFKFGRYLMPVFFISMGLVITWSAFFGTRSFKSIDLMGCIFIVMGIIYLVYNIKVVNSFDNNTSAPKK
jgi:hypothetical protein